MEQAARHIATPQGVATHPSTPATCEEKSLPTQNLSVSELEYLGSALSTEGYRALLIKLLPLAAKDGYRLTSFA